VSFESAGNAIGVLDGGSGISPASVELTAAPTAVAAGLGYVWAASADSNAVHAIDPETNTVHQTIGVGNAPGGLAVGDRYVWVTNSFAGTVTQIDPKALSVIQKIPVGNGPTGVAVGDGNVWVANTFDHTVSKIRARDGKLLKNYPAVTDPGALAVGDGAVWVASKSRDTVVKLNPDNGHVLDKISVGQVPAAVAVGLGSVWVANSEDGTVTQIDPASDREVGRTRVGDGPIGIAIVGGEVWTANEDGTISRIDPGERLPKTITVGNRLSALAAADGTVYVALRPTGTAHRGGTLRVALPFLEPLETLDLAAGSLSTFFWGFAPLTNDGLLTYRHVGGQAGNQLVANLARDLPDVSPDRKTYTFRLRPNIRYSNGRLVRASDFRYAIERVFKLRLRTKDFDAATSFRAIRGADRCDERRCNLAAGIYTDDVNGTIEIHLSAPDPYFLYRLTFMTAAVVPHGTSLREQRRRPLPATGPYRIASVTRDSVRLTRNPYFDEWSDSAQPAGFPDEIVLKRVPMDKGIALVQHEKADLTSNFPLKPFPVAAMFRPRVHQHPANGTLYLVLDLGKPPFNDPRARRALNYALDRSKLARLATRGSPSEPTCQVLPPNFPGYRRHCRYPLDLAKAAQLVEASGTAGASVTLWVDSEAVAIRIGRSMKVLLRRLGYRPRLRIFEGSPRKYFRRLEGGAMSHKNGPQVAFGGWAADYPAASSFIQELFSCGSKFNYSRFCDGGVERRINRAVELEQTDPQGASLLWAQLDHEITKKALWVPLFNIYRADFVSNRVGNYQYSPWFGPLLSQLWVR
jgi:peptide/nickel transport system substrate-binding protein